MKPCRECGDDFEPFNSLTRVCSPKCALSLAQKKRKKKEKKIFNAETKRRKEALKTKPAWTKEAQKSENRYVRLRDKNEPCISCGRYNHEINEHIRGGKWDCGHYLSRGAHPELRFHLWNMHKQCKSCNGGSGKYSGKNRTVTESFRFNLVKKIGIEKVEWLDGPHEPNHLDIEYLKRLKRIFNRKARLKERRHD